MVAILLLPLLGAMRNRLNAYWYVVVELLPLLGAMRNGMPPRPISAAIARVATPLRGDEEHRTRRGGRPDRLVATPLRGDEELGIRTGFSSGWISCYPS